MAEALAPRDVTAAGLCIGCGGCATGKAMAWDKFGQRKPEGAWTAERSEAFARTCPFSPEAANEDEDPVIDPDGCAWIAGGLEKFVIGHEKLGELVTFDSVGEVLRTAIADSRLAEQQLRWLESRMDSLRDESGGAPQWAFPLSELAVLAGFYRRCGERGFAVFADY